MFFFCECLYQHLCVRLRVGLQFALLSHLFHLLHFDMIESNVKLIQFPFGILERNKKSIPFLSFVG